ncbi:MAG: ABC transporter substrate-binding protein [Chthoniobacteraceae bacterium]
MNTLIAEPTLSFSPYSKPTASAPGALDYLGYTPCALQKELRTQVSRLLQGLRRADGELPEWEVPIGSGETGQYKDLWRTENASALPELISDFGNGDFFSAAFRNRWIDGGEYAPMGGYPTRPEFREAGLADPNGLFHVYGALPYVILADLPKLGSRPLPRRWADLLDPRYRGDLIIGGVHERPGEVILYNFHKEFGQEGLTALGRNVKAFWHGAQMAKAAGSDHPAGAALYVLPWFLAINNPHRDRTELVWPEDGMLTVPLYFIGKGNPGPAAKRIADFLAGPGWARMVSRIGFAANPAGGPIPGKLRWIGWDYLATHDWEALREPLGEAFRKGYRP